MMTLLFGRQLYILDFDTNLGVNCCVLCFEDQFALRRHLLCGKMVITFSTLNIDIVLLLTKLDPEYEVSIRKLMHNEKLINVAHQK